MNNQSILIIDAYNLFLRHYIANTAMSSNGAQIGGIIGFLSTIRHLCETIFPKSIYICWEGSNGSAKKRLIYKEYKSNRKPPKLNRYYEDDIPDTAENKNWQVLTLVELLRNTPICQLYISDTEADDLVGYLCKYKFKNEEKIIVSNDKDFYQLLNDKTKIYSPNKKLFITQNEVMKQFEISTANFCLAKIINGDDSDNIKGIKGAGFKTIAKRFPILAEQEQKNINDIVSICEEKVKEKKCLSVYKEILNNQDILNRNWRLMYLDTNNIGAHHIKKLDQIVDDFKPRSDKLSFIKKLYEKGISNFNVENFLFSLNCIQR